MPNSLYKKARTESKLSVRCVKWQLATANVLFAVFLFGVNREEIQAQLALPGLAVWSVVTRVNEIYLDWGWLALGVVSVLAFWIISRDCFTVARLLELVKTASADEVRACESAIAVRRAVASAALAMLTLGLLVGVAGSVCALKSVTVTYGELLGVFAVLLVMAFAIYALLFDIVHQIYALSDEADRQQEQAPHS